MKEKKRLVHFYLYFDLIMLIVFFFLMYAAIGGYLSSDIRAASTAVIFALVSLWWIINTVALVVVLVSKQKLQLVLASVGPTVTPLFMYIVAINSTDQLTDLVMLAITVTINLVLCIIALKTTR